VARTLGFQPKEAGSKPVRATINIVIHCPIDQLVDRLTLTQKVLGSNPSRASIIIGLTNDMNDVNKERVLLSLKERKVACWGMAKVFLLNEDAHGIHDMGVEIQALDRAIKEIESL